MAKLDLQPDLSLIVVQSGLFLINLYIVNFFFVKPFLLLKRKRDEVTRDRLREAEAKAKERELLLKKIEGQLGEALLAGTKRKEEIVKQALAEQKDIIAKAREAASLHVKQIKEEIEKKLQKECNRVPSLVSGLAGDIYKELIKK